MSVAAALAVGVLAFPRAGVWAAPAPTQPSATPNLAAPAVPEPEPQASDEVQLTNGGMYRGTISEMVPGGHVTIVPMGGKARRIEWKDVAGVVRDGQALEITPAPESEQEPEGPYLHVEVDGKGEVELREVVTDITVLTPEGTAHGYVHKRVCTVPCARRLGNVTDRQFYFSAGGVGSGRFALEGRGSSIEATVRPGNIWFRYGGVSLVVLGGGTAVGGITTAAISSRTSVGRNMTIAGGVLVGVGVPILIGGIIMALRGKTKVTFN